MVFMDTPDLPDLLREVAPKVLWEFLSPRPKDADYDSSRVAARAMALQGFQQVPANLRLPAVQKRLLDWFTRHPDAAELLRMRHEASPAPREAPPARADDGAVSLEERIVPLEEWRMRAERAEAQFKEQRSEVNDLRERLRASAREIERRAKEEKQRETAAAKKLELAQTAAQEQLAQLRQHDERETRRLNAAERERDELDSTVKVLRKQLRHVNQLLDEQAKKIAALEARLNPPAPPPTPAPPSPTPLPKPAKAARPSPLDEVFVWLAGRSRVPRLAPRSDARR